MFLSQRDEVAPHMGRTLGDRFLGSLYASAVILTLSHPLTQFLQQKVHGGGLQPMVDVLVVLAFLNVSPTLPGPQHSPPRVLGQALF